MIVPKTTERNVLTVPVSTVFATVTMGTVDVTAKNLVSIIDLYH